MSTSEIIACSRELVKAKQARDAAVKALELDRAPPDPWTTISVTPDKEGDGDES
jgi:hypothetical protein